MQWEPEQAQQECRQRKTPHACTPDLSTVVNAEGVTVELTYSCVLTLFQGFYNTTYLLQMVWLRPDSRTVPLRQPAAESGFF
jgi:hypothetical protein